MVVLEKNFEGKSFSYFTVFVDIYHNSSFFFFFHFIILVQIFNFFQEANGVSVSQGALSSRDHPRRCRESLEERQQAVNLAKIGVRNRRGRRMQVNCGDPLLLGMGLLEFTVLDLLHSVSFDYEYAYNYRFSVVRTL